MRTLTPAPHLTDDPDARGPLPRIEGRIAYEDVSFAYGRQAGGVEDIDLVIEPGQKTGHRRRRRARASLRSCRFSCGSTTPRRGASRWTGPDIRDVDAGQPAPPDRDGHAGNGDVQPLRDGEHPLTAGPRPPTKEVYAAAKRAEAHDFILSLRDHRGREGYGAHLGERGVKLSGGQRQRIALARAFPQGRAGAGAGRGQRRRSTARWRPRSSRRFSDVMEGKTVIAIAHRLSTLAAMDRIIVLDAGRIVEDGTHQAACLRRTGLYARYWNRQSGRLSSTRRPPE